MNYEQFKEKMMIAIDFDNMAIEDIEEHIQELYTTWKLTKSDDIILFCKEQVTGTSDDSCMWLSSRGMELLKLRNDFKNYNPFPVFGSRI